MQSQSFSISLPHHKAFTDRNKPLESPGCPCFLKSYPKEGVKAAGRCAPCGRILSCEKRLPGHVWKLRKNKIHLALKSEAESMPLGLVSAADWQHHSGAQCWRAKTTLELNLVGVQTLPAMCGTWLCREGWSPQISLWEKCRCQCISGSWSYQGNWLSLLSTWEAAA